MADIIIQYNRPSNSFNIYCYVQVGNTPQTNKTDVKIDLFEWDSGLEVKGTQILNDQVLIEVSAINFPGWYVYNWSGFTFDQDYVIDYWVDSLLPNGIDIEYLNVSEIIAASLVGTVVLNKTQFQEVTFPRQVGFWNPALFVADNTKTGSTTGTALTLSTAPSFTIEVGDRIRVRSGAQVDEIREVTTINTQTSLILNNAFTADQSTISMLVYKPRSGIVEDATTSNIVNLAFDQMCSTLECWFQLNGGVYADYNNDTRRDDAFKNNIQNLSQFITVANSAVGGIINRRGIDPATFVNAAAFTDPEVNFPLSTNVDNKLEFTAMFMATKKNIDIPVEF